MSFKRSLILVASIVGLYVLANVAYLLWRTGTGADEVTVVTLFPAASDQGDSRAALPGPQSFSADGGSASADTEIPSPMALPEPTHGSDKSLGAMEAAEIAYLYDFDRLYEDKGKLGLDNDTKILIENLFDMRSTTEIRQAIGKVEQAASLHLSSAAASEFGEVVLQFADYRTSLNEFDEQLNAMGATGDQVDWSTRVMQETQDSAFGAERASALFGTHRAILAAMERHRVEAGGSMQNLSPEDVERMQREYQQIVERGAAVPPR